MKKMKKNDNFPSWEQTGVVSLWVGKVDTKEHFDEMLRVYISDNGEYLGSRFTRGFGIDFYDEGFQEAEFVARAVSGVDDLLLGVSYADVVVPRFKALLPVLSGSNAFVLLYNYFHHDPREWGEAGAEFRFVGVVSYVP